MRAARDGDDVVAVLDDAVVLDCERDGGCARDAAVPLVVPRDVRRDNGDDTAVPAVLVRPDDDSAALAAAAVDLSPLVCACFNTRMAAANADGVKLASLALVNVGVARVPVCVPTPSTKKLAKNCGAAMASAGAGDDGQSLTGSTSARRACVAAAGVRCVCKCEMR